MITTPGTLVKKVKLDAFTLIVLCAGASAVFLVLCLIWSDPWWGYAAVFASVAGVCVYVADKLIRWHRARPSTADEQPEAGAAAPPEGGAAADPADAGPAIEEAPVPAEEAAAPTATEPEDAGDVIVATIPGRRRFHALTCGLLGKDSYEEITEAEARAEGFTPCTACSGTGTSPALYGR